MKVEGCYFPDDLLYDTDGNIWVREEGGKARLGITSIVSWLSGGFTSVSFKQPGSRVESGRVLGSVEGFRRFDVVRAPFDCVIVSVNERLLSEPRLLNRDSYGTGWFAVVQPLSDLHASLLAGERATGALSAAVKRLGVRCFAAFPDHEMYEIGVECSAVLVKLDDLLSGSRPGTVVHIVSDDNSAEVEMERWVGRTGNELLETRREGALHHFLVRKR